MKRVYLIFFIIILLYPSHLAAVERDPDIEIDINEAQEIDTQYTKGQVIKILEENIINENADGFPTGKQKIKVKLVEGKYKGQTVTIDNTTSGNPTYDYWVEAGDELVLILHLSGNELINVDVEDYVRDNSIYYLIGVFILLIIIIGQGKGIKSIITLLITVLIIAKVTLPLLFQGQEPVTTALISAVIITALTLTIIGGISRKTISAILGTTGGLFVASKIAMAFGKLANLRGVSDEEAQILIGIQGINYDFQGLLFAGIIIGALGAVMDVSMSIASSMDEVNQVRGDLGRLRIMASGMRVGKDIMGTMSNTLILAYTGASLNTLLLLMAHRPPFLKVINADFIATEFIRSLSGSIGLILSIPITAIVAGILMSRRQ